ncbi:bacillithiol system redox-active protein YtxJ [Flavihumibacter sp. RY-1]|uniref:Bacillithiol system redox-active protein YtxJ n=1 Tax=Flavihumibacter fluminis TaxID=2909236 RepID=A0ABS9BHL3_9BACT|nr:bacillithiol system redox-active protein YtxJ [Flavihumibacter fluminis]MCF1714735.1 bacillithiol system redox-active protein YtxJ [Flavihumibacter fluminis]
MNWNMLSSLEQIEIIRQASLHKPQVIFKHSTRCSISAMAKNRLEKSTPPEGIDFHYLDLIQYRPVSNAVADTFGVEHESPQILLIRNESIVYTASHMGISMPELEAAINSVHNN